MFLTVHEIWTQGRQGVLGKKLAPLLLMYTVQKKISSLDTIQYT
jgi:hypothetical protein